jgi:hypothetical protein
MRSADYRPSIYGNRTESIITLPVYQKRVSCLPFDKMTTPADVLSTSDPGDDMQRRIRYQAAYGALLSLQLVSDSEMSELFCEQHEDFLVRKANGLFVGYQVKTRLPHLGPFKSDDGSMINAMERFVNLDIDFPDQFESFVIVSNCDFWQAEDNGKNLASLIKRMKDRPGAKLTGTASEIVDLLREKCGCTKKKITAVISKIRLDGRVRNLRILLLP